LASRLNLRRAAERRPEKLKGAPIRLAALASLNNKAITVDFARESLRHLVREEGRRI
jgi:chromosomal replication initiation ATPase DnaA